ncbi:serine hydrolase [Treponema phagedenis]|uniref:serine hydrolase n=1 Tax=Treponema phagedenis TaxID=162 RepID=UPI001C06A661|nr:serine hydrolase [Treponema phagedenis]
MKLMKKLKAVLVLSVIIVISAFLVSCGKTLEKTVTTQDKKIQEDMHLPKELDASLDTKIDGIVQKYIENGTITGGVILASKDGKIVFEKAYGYAHLYELTDVRDLANPKAKRLKTPQTTELNTLYDLASCTKVMATTQSIMKLYFEGKLTVTDKVAKYLPEFAQNGKENVTIEQLLTHTSGLPQWKPTFLYVNKDRNAELQLIEQLPLIFKPGEVKYSDFGFMTLGFIVEKITGMGMDAYVETEIYKPLGMTNTMYKPLDKGIPKNRIAATSWGNPFEYRMVDEERFPDFGYDCTEDKEAFKKFKGWRTEVLTGQTNDGNTAMANDGVAGHAGVFSTAEDLAILGQLMLNGGTYNSITLYDQKTIDLFSANHLGENNRGYGFEMKKKYMGKTATDKMFGHNGFTGTHVTFDKENNMQIIVLTNKQNLGLTKAGKYHSTFDLAAEVADVFVEKLTKEAL